MNLNLFFFTVITMMLMIIIGIIVEIRLKTNEKVKETLIFIIINVAIPSVIINGIFNSDLDKNSFRVFTILIISSLIIFMLGVTLGFLIGKLFKYTTYDARLMSVISGQGNSGFIGIPLCASTFGPLGGAYASFYDIGTALSVFSIGIMLLQKNMNLSWKILKSVVNPPVLASVSGLIASLIGFKPPLMLMQLTDVLSGLAAPLAMIYIGIIIPGAFKIIKQKKYFKMIVLPSATRLLVVPILTIFVVSYLPLMKIIKEIIIVLSAMPTGLLVSVLIARYGHDGNFGTLAVVYTSIGSLLTIPLIVYLSQLILY